MLKELWLLAEQHRWMPLAVLVIGWLTQLTKSTSLFPLNIPDRWRPVVVLVLGQAYAVVQAIAGGMTPKDAILEGLETSIVTLGLFAVVIKAAFDGKVPQPLAALALMFPPSKPTERGFARFDAVLAIVICASLGGVAVAVMSVGCSADQNRRLGVPIATGAQKACILANALLPDDMIRTLCRVVDLAAPEIRDWLEAGRRAGLEKERAGYAPGKGIPLAAFEDLLRDAGAQ